MATIVTGDLYYELDGMLLEITRQLRQKGGYGFDPELLRKHLQAGIEGRFVGSVEKKPSLEKMCTESMGEYFTPIFDSEVPEQFQSILVKYRTIARAWGIADSVAICYHVRAGFTLKQHAPKFGKCYKDFEYLQGWNFADEPTVDCYVFWVPCIVPDSTSKTYSEQLRLLAEIRVKYELPAHHLTDLGAVAENAGLILAHKKATGLLIPLGGKWIRTATSDADGDRLRLGGHDASGLYCSFWDFGESRSGGLGVFARGVEFLGR